VRTYVNCCENFVAFKVINIGASIIDMKLALTELELDLQLVASQCSANRESKISWENLAELQVLGGLPISLRNQQNSHDSIRNDWSIETKSAVRDSPFNCFLRFGAYRIPVETACGALAHGCLWDPYRRQASGNALTKYPLMSPLFSPRSRAHRARIIISIPFTVVPAIWKTGWADALTTMFIMSNSGLGSN